MNPKIRSTTSFWNTQRRSRYAIGIAAIGCAALLSTWAAAQESAPRYPVTRKVDVVEELHGVKVADPYRWLEDLDSEETARWVAAQNEVTFGYLRAIPQREAIRERLETLWDYEKFGTPREKGGRYFFTRNSGLQNQSVLYVSESLGGEARVLLDPNKLSADGTVALSGTYISDDGKLLAYGVSNAGSDWKEIRVRNVDSRKDLPDVIKWVKFSGASWTDDGQGFFYSRYDEPQGNKLASTNYYQKLYFHALGTPQSQDSLIYERPDEKEWGFGGSVSEDGRYLIISVWKGSARKKRIFYQDLEAGDGKTVELLNDFDAMYSFVGNDGPVFWFFTNLDAPRGRLIAIDTRSPGRENWKEIIPEAKETLRGVGVVNDQFVASYLQDAHTLVRILELTGKHVRDVGLPGIGSAGGFGGERDDTETFYSYSSFNEPLTIYRYDMTSGRSTVFRRPKVDFKSDEFEVKQVFYESKDGTRVPMFICHKKGVKLDGSNPTLLYGYGGFNIPLTPRFSISNVVWMEMGGVYVQANIRGGGEYGKTWHDAGKLGNKQNCFDDFIAAAEWLIEKKYTRSEKLAIFGGSNGGLLVGACMTQRPELFAAAMPAVGVLDMLRFHKFTIGWAWTSDYGSPDDAEMFAVLRAYSPYHNLKAGTHYPATLITTGDHDDRVVPAHSFKFAAALQEANAGENPMLIRIETRAGHGAGKPTAKIIEEQADRWAFLVKTLEMSVDGDRF